MIGACHLEKILEVISGLSHLTLDITLSGGDELLIGVIDILVIVTLIVVDSDCDSLGSSF
jgi:hypothetical protein